MGRDLRPSHPIQELGLLGCELRLGDHAALAEVVQLVELRRNRRAGTRLGRDLLVRARTVHAGGVGFHLPVDLVLHEGRLAYVLERLRPALTGTLDPEITEAEHSLEHRLAEEDGVDPLERDLDSALADNTDA